jgi:uncharacterized damage-inducible protein DinB
MHGGDILYYGHDFLLRALNGLDKQYFDTEPICGVWTTKDVIAHLASHELFFIDVLHTVLEIDAPKPSMDIMFQVGPGVYNDSEVDKRKSMSYQEVWEEYDTARQKVEALWAQVPEEKLRQSGLLEWYGAEYDLEDFMVYSFYGHKREHSAQINILKDKFK